jgi:hypothetical protein
MHTKDKSVFTLPNGSRIIGFDSLEVMAKILNITVMEFADGYGQVLEKLVVSRLTSKKTLDGRLEE